MIAAMLTAPRAPDYFETAFQSLESTGFFSSDMAPLHVFFGSPAEDHMKSYKEDGRFVFHSLESEEDRNLWARLDTKQRCAFGHYSLMKNVPEGDWDEILILEDDVRFAQGWQEHLRKVLGEVREAHGKRWMASLYCLRAGVREKYDEGKRWFFTPGHFFWGTQGIVYPREIIPGLAAWIYENSLKEFRHPIDGSIGHYGIAKEIPTIVIVPSLVQHLGRVTTGQSNYYHRANLFLDPVKDPILGEPWRKS